MNPLPFYVREYIAAFRAAHGREPRLAQCGSWWQVEGITNVQKNELIRMTIHLEGRAAAKAQMTTATEDDK